MPSITSNMANSAAQPFQPLAGPDLAAAPVQELSAGLFPFNGYPEDPARRSWIARNRSFVLPAAMLLGALLVAWLVIKKS